MTKIFEIPVYAFSKGVLQKRYSRYADNWKKQNPNVSQSHTNVCLTLLTHPQRVWDYNHIVGFIRISSSNRDINFDRFLPTNHAERYSWRSSKKTFLDLMRISGSHFYVYDNMSNSDIQIKVSEMLNGIIRNHIPKRYYVDTESFDTLNGMIDYISIIEGNCNNGQV